MRLQPDRAQFGSLRASPRTQCRDRAPRGALLASQHCRRDRRAERGGRAPGRARRVARRRGRSAGSCYPAATQRPQFEPGRCLHRCLHLRFPAPHHHVPSWRSQVRILPGSPLRNGPFRAHAFVNRLGGVALAPGSCANWRAMLIPKHAAAAPRTAADVSKSLAGSNKHHAERAPISAMTRTARWCGIACQNNCPAPVASGPAAVAPAQRGS